MKIFTDPQHTTFALHMSLKSAVNTGFRQRVFEELPGSDAHVDGEALPIGSG
jgi:hypothetical protein